MPLLATDATPKPERGAVPPVEPPDWLAGQPAELWMIPISALGIYLAVVLFTRLNGLRSFSTMSGFDFAITVATGSLIATTLLSPEPSLLGGTIGLATLFALQRLVSHMRRRWPFMERLVDNEPILLMHRGEILDHHMRKARITREDLHAKLRQAGVARAADVEAVVFETTGTFSIIRRQEGGLDDFVFQDVRT